MKQKATIDRVLRYIKRKTQKTSDGKEVVSKLHAELAAKMAFEGGRLNVLDNILELKWADEEGVLYCENESFIVSIATTSWEDYVIIFHHPTKTYELIFAEETLASKCQSITEAKRIAEEDYKRRIYKTLKLYCER